MNNIENKTQELAKVVAKGTDRSTTKATLVEALSTALLLIEEAKQFNPEADKKAKSVKQVLTEVEELIENIEDIDARLKEGDMTIKDAIVERKANFTKIVEGIELKNAELKELYGVESSLQQLVVLINAHKAVLKANKEELDAVKAEIIEAKKIHNDAIIEENRNLAKSRKIEQEEYDYKKKISRRNEADTWAQEQKEIKSDFIGSFEKRGDELDRREASLESMRDSAVETLEEADKKMATARQVEEDAKKNTDKAVAIATSSLKKELTGEHKIELLTVQGEIKILESKLASALADAEKANARATVAEENAKQAYTQLTAVASKPVTVQAPTVQAK